MKNTARSFFLILLSGLILFTSTGFGLIEHSCSMRGKKTYSFVSKDMCKVCYKKNKSSKGKTTIAKSKCCDEKRVENQENISKSIVNLTGKLLKSSAQLVANAFVWVFTTAFEAFVNITQAQKDEPNSLFGKNLLIFINTFRL
jgi:hypothetical protein